MEQTDDIRKEIAARLELARQIAHEAGQLTLRYFRNSDLLVERKSDQSPITIADREAEELLRKRIMAAFADDGIVGEEFDEKPGTSRFQWMLDPIDGTKSFICGVPLYGTMVGVTRDDLAVIGVIEIPALGESIHAATDCGAWYSTQGQAPVRAAVSKVDQLKESLFCTTEIDTFDQTGRTTVFDQLQGRARLTRTWGDCYGYVLVATGRAEVMIDPQLSVWDTTALKPIVEEAGGTLTDFQGRPTVFSGEAVATNGRVVDEVLAITKGN